MGMRQELSLIHIYAAGTKDLWQDPCSPGIDHICIDHVLIDHSQTAVHSACKQLFHGKLLHFPHIDLIQFRRRVYICLLYTSSANGM